MILALSIRDFALVERLDLEFGRGFTVFTGETGAGKSILLKALGLLLGERADRDLVRTGAQSARVEGAFALSGPSLAAAGAILEEAGIPWEDTLLIARTVSAEGGSRAFLNGVGVGVAVLSRLGAYLVEVSSQHQHQGLLDEKKHLSFLDAALDEKGVAALGCYQEGFQLWDAARSEVQRLKKQEKLSDERKDFLKFQLGEVKALDLKPGEDDELNAERGLLANAEKVAGAYENAVIELSGDDTSALARVDRALKYARKAAQNDPRAVEAADLLAEALLALKEAGRTFEERFASVKADPARLDQLETRLEAISRLARKHGPTVADILLKEKKMEAELWELENREAALGDALAEEEKALKALKAQAARLTLARGEASTRLASAVGAELSQLGLDADAFIISQKPCEPGPDGADEVRFLFMPNKGEEPKPLAAIASGGELSRVLLAVKNALRDRSVETLVFDEVDAGIGGRTADRVGERLEELAADCQVLCITHLVQLASRAPLHQRVEKTENNGRTVTTVRLLGEDERVAEFARMLGAGEKPDAAWEHARQLAARGRVS